MFPRRRVTAVEEVRAPPVSGPGQDPLERHSCGNDVRRGRRAMGFYVVTMATASWSHETPPMRRAAGLSFQRSLSVWKEFPGRRN